MQPVPVVLEVEDSTLVFIIEQRRSDQKVRRHTITGNGNICCVDPYLKVYPALCCISVEQILYNCEIRRSALTSGSCGCASSGSQKNTNMSISPETL